MIYLVQDGYGGLHICHCRGIFSIFRIKGHGLLSCMHIIAHGRDTSINNTLYGYIFKCFPEIFPVYQA